MSRATPAYLRRDSRDYLDTIPRSYKHVELREHKAMTVALGIWCDDGIVLCTDSQITIEGGLKYPGFKIDVMKVKDWAVGLAFAGSADLKKLISDRMFEALIDSRNDHPQWELGVRAILERTVKEICTQHKDKTIELLCATTADRGGKALFRARNKLVTESELAECIGVGDSSVLHFLADTFVRHGMQISQALLLGCYMASKATTYITHCDGPIQAAVLTDEGDGYVVDLADYEKAIRLEGVEQSLRHLFHYLCWENDSEKRKQLFRSFEEEIGDFDWTKLITPEQKLRGAQVYKDDDV